MYYPNLHQNLLSVGELEKDGAYFARTNGKVLLERLVKLGWKSLFLETFQIH